MTWKIVIEVIAGIVILVLGNIFWSCIKTPKYLADVLSDYDELRKYVIFATKEKLIELAEFNTKAFDPSIISFESIISSLLTISNEKRIKTRTLVTIFIFLILIGSIFLQWYFVLINIGLFLIIGLNGIASFEINNVFSDIHSIILAVYRWNKTDHVKCEEFCTVTNPRFLKIFRLVTTELIK